MREDAILTWDPIGTDWVNDAAEDEEIVGDERPCPTCGQMVAIKDKHEAAYEMWIDWGAEEEWEYFTEELSHLLARLAPDGRIRIEGHGMGWQQRSGWMDLDLIPHKGSNTGMLFLRKAMPNTEYHLWAWARDNEGNCFNPWTAEATEVKKISIEIAHHDAPTGGEVYYVTRREEEAEDEE